MEALAWIGFVVVAWYLPGMVAAQLFFRDAPAPVYLAVCWAAAPVLFSALAVGLGIAGVDPLVVSAVIALGGAAALARVRPWRRWATVVRGAPWVFVVPVLFGVASSLMPPEQSLTSDGNAHVAAIRRSVEEAAVFPERGFHGDEASSGVDPRFGTLHAWNAVACRVTGLEPRQAWQAMRGAGLAMLLAGALALMTAVATRWQAVALGMLALLATHGGGYYSILSVSAYPLWFSLGIVWGLVGFALRGGLDRAVPAGVVAGAALAGLVGIHFFAYMLGGFLVGVLALTASSEQRRAALGALVTGATVSLPWVAARLLTSYVNDNPIHQKVWQCMEWVPGLYSANPTFILGWLFPFGALALLWGLFSWRRLRRIHAFRWLMWSAILALAWIIVPWLLTPSMELVGFLPLRLLMGVGGAFLLALLVDRLERPRTVVAVLLVVLLAPGFALRVERILGSGPAGMGQWEELVDALPTSVEGRPNVLSDPFTMLALSADAAVDVVAVPDGRSSPRDADAIERLRDAWRGMSAATGGRATDAVLERREVTHVVINRGLPAGLASYEYPVHTPSFKRQLEKFASNPGRFHRLWSGGTFELFEVRNEPDLVWDETWRRSCRIEEEHLSGRVAIGSGYEVAAAADVVDAGDHRILQVTGELGWAGSGSAPDRQLIVRLDRSPSSVPASLAGVAKPVRKLRELLGAPHERYRWTTSAGMGRCPTWRAGEAPLAIDLEFRLPDGVMPGDYIVTLAARDRSVFEPIRLRDFFVDDDSWRGPVIATVRVN